VVDVQRETEVPGGAGNVAANMAALGAQVHLVSLIGDDISAERLISLLDQSHIQTDALVRTCERPTIVKTRVIAQHQQVVRFDREKRGELSAALQTKLRVQIDQILPSCKAAILSDYAKGVLSPSLINHVITRALRLGIPITVDPKVENFARYKHVTTVTPNLKEALECGGMRSAGDLKALEVLGWRLQGKIRSQSVLITRGDQGMSLFEKGRPALHIPTRAKEVFDVTGAGDTVISVMTLARAAGASLREAAELANFAAGVVVAKVGTACVSQAEILKAVGQHHG